MRVSRRGHTPPFQVMEIVKAATLRQESHGDAILLCVGQPATPAPEVVRRAASEAVAGQVLGYTESRGTTVLRERIARHYAETYKVAVDPEEVVVTTGSSAGFLLTLMAAFDPDDAVAMTRPGYPAYRNDLNALGLRVRDLDAGPATRYQPSVGLLEELCEVPAGLVLASPSNPTGTIIDAAELTRLAAWCEEHESLLISDEIYHGISYGRECMTARRVSADAVVLGSLSKYHSMTGWRLGWLLLPEALRRPIEQLQGNLSICAPAVSQAAALAAFEPEATDELDAHVARYSRNRDLLLRRLPELGITSFAPPDGAFYAYCDVSGLTDDSYTWCYEVLDATGVALAPGTDFDTSAGHTMVRLSFCGATDELDEALDRLAGYLSSVPGKAQ